MTTKFAQQRVQAVIVKGCLAQTVASALAAPVVASEAAMWVVLMDVEGHFQPDGC